MPDQRTIILGIVGDSAAGKTTLSSGIAEILGRDRVTIICTDDYHKYNRVQRRRLGISALNPTSNYIDIIEQHLAHLRRGEPILKPVYNHGTGDFDQSDGICADLEGIMVLKGWVETTKQRLGRWLADDRVYMIDTVAVELSQLLAQRHADIVAGRKIIVSPESPFWRLDW